MKSLLITVVVLNGLVYCPANSNAALVVAPSNLATVDGQGNNRVPAFAGRTIRTQQVFASAEFSGLAGPELITSIAFRADRLVDSGPVTLSSFQVNLSTTSKAVDLLSEVFSENIGDDETMVFNGSWTLSSNHIGNPKSFDVILDLDTPFPYAPSAGNLLIDMRTLVSPTGDFVLDGDNVIGDSISRVISLDADPALGVNAASGVTSSFGLVTQFTTLAHTVPEPTTVAIWSLLGVGLVTRRRKRKAALNGRPNCQRSCLPGL